MALNPMSVRFWGVRGSIACPGPDTIRYGGNTSCVEVRCGEHLLVFDAGSGLRLLGSELAGTTSAPDVDLFLSHCHIDHLIGLPFFAPLFEGEHCIRVWGGNLKSSGGIREAVGKFMSFPLFPVGIEVANGKVDFLDFDAGDILKPRPDIVVQTALLNHPGGATGYRVEYQDRAIAYVTDTALGDPSFDNAILGLVKDAAFVIIDTTYTDDELPAHAGWGHASWQQAVRLADEAGVKTLCLFHHDPEHLDPMMDEIAAAVEKARPGTVVAREGLVIQI
ncbi:MBL fold metallo-hydrolase [Afipia sp. TerB]